MSKLTESNIENAHLDQIFGFGWVFFSLPAFEKIMETK